MNTVPSTTTIPPNSSTAIRPRNRRSNIRDNDAELADTVRTAPVPQLDGPHSSFLRAPSPLPNQHPSRSASSNRDSQSPRRNNVSGSPSLSASQATPSTLATGLWGTSWSSLQGIASNLLGSDPLSTSNTIRSTQKRRRRPWQATHSRYFSVLPVQWGPLEEVERQPGSGTPEDRLAQVQALKRERLLASNGNLTPDASGRYKRRNSAERGPKTSDSEDQDALVYLHRVQQGDTLAGVTIKYGCQPNVFRKANRLWPNDSIQVRRTVYLPVDACSVKGRKVTSPGSSIDLFEHDRDNDFMQTPTNTRFLWGDSATSSEAKETPVSSIPTSPSISVTLSNTEEAPWKHDSWVLIDGFPDPVEIVRLSRQTLGFFPPRRRQSPSFWDLETPPQSLDLPRSNYQDTASPRRRNSNSRSSSGSYFATHLHGPGGVGSLGKEVRSPGPGQDGLNKLLAHLPNIAPRASFESTHSNTSSVEHVGGAIEGWVRKLATRAAATVQPPALGGNSGVGDLIELSAAFELEDVRDHEAIEGGQEGTNRCVNLNSGASTDWSDEQERLLRERFPPRGRVFQESSKRKGG